MAGVFISYRRSDSAGHTGRLADDLAEGLEEQQLFRDIEAIEAGEDFVDALNRAVSACSVMLVVIGPTWARVQTPDGKRRLHEPGDFVRAEIEAALAKGVRVIPVLVGDAQMPQAEDLPESMQPLLRRNAYVVSDRRWQYDVGQLLEILEKIPGIARRRQRESVPEAPIVPPAKSGMATWMKVAIGSGVTVLVIFALMMMTGGDPARTDVPPQDSASESAPAEFAGLWRTDENLYYAFAQDGDALIANSGDFVGPTSDPAHLEVRPATKAGVQLTGRSVPDGRNLEIILTDAFSNETEKLTLTLAEDGRTMEGSVVGGTDAQPARIVLHRV